MSKLTALAVKQALKHPGTSYDGDGLCLVVKASLAASWVLRIQASGRRRDIGLGSVKDFTLAEAREKAAETRKQIRNGIDPVAAKRNARSEAALIPTFKVAATKAHGDRKEAWRNGKHQAQWLSTLQRYVFPSLGGRQVDRIDAPAVIDVLQPIWLKKPETARRVKQRVCAVLNWAHAKGHRPTEAPQKAIEAGLGRQPRKDRHFEALEYERLPALMDMLSTKDTVGCLALRFLILTAARSGEVRGAKWDEIHLSEKRWIIPAERMKAHRQHIVPLTDAAIAILKLAAQLRTGRNAGLVFPGIRGKSLSDMTLSKALRSVLPTTATVHGFRSCFRDWAAECTDYSGDVVEAALAHTNPNKVEAAYRRTDFLEKRIPLMSDWSNFARRKQQRSIPKPKTAPNASRKPAEGRPAKSGPLGVNGGRKASESLKPQGRA